MENQQQPISQIPPTNPATLPQAAIQVPPVKTKSNNLKLLLIAVGVVFIFLIGILGSVAFIVSKFKANLPFPTATPQGQEQSIVEPEIKNPSRYATDSGVLKIKSDLDALDKDINSADLNENNLRPPDIQFDESF